MAKCTCATGVEKFDVQLMSPGVAAAATPPSPYVPEGARGTAEGPPVDLLVRCWPIVPGRERPLRES